ncbi:MAG: glutamate synthase subunit alpha, partial [Deltaproteobacteria bacterium]|nr:glutamate synthase subunit alpha [Deltaproteobacteria bacterium]
MTTILKYSTHGLPIARGLYNPANEHDSCGVGFVANIDGQKSHDVIEKGIRVLENLMHRGAIGGDLSTGDGAGILFQVPHDFLIKACGPININLPQKGNYGVGMVFMPRDSEPLQTCIELVEKTITSQGLSVLGWREVPINADTVSGQARKQRPQVMQFFVDGKGLKDIALERKLYIIRKCIENNRPDIEILNGCFYIPSLSCRTIVYKGLFTAPQLAGFYNDLRDPALKSAMAVVHQRYSTNTFPSWELAQPFRYLAHNGEINTLRGNLNHIRSRESSLESGLFGEDIKKL